MRSFSVVIAEVAGVQGIKKAKDCLTLAVSINMDGSHIIHPFVIGNSANPHQARNMDVAAFCDYDHSK